MQVPMEQLSREPELLASVARLTLLRRLAGALAHEFRNPLTTIFLHADILEDTLRRLESGQGPQLLHFLRVMREEVGRIDDLIQQYFWLARLPELEAATRRPGRVHGRLCPGDAGIRGGAWHHAGGGRHA